MSKSKKKYYVVWVGAKPGIYESWDQAKAQIAGFPGAKYKSFSTKAEAERAYRQAPSNHIGKGSGSAKSKAAVVPRSKIVWNSISVDAACSGNPGVMEYQGVHTKTGQQIFHQKFQLGTNNIGEFLAIVHALALCEKQGKDTPIYTDSRTALAWVRNKKCKSTLPRDAHTEKLWQLVDRAEEWLKTHTWKNPILKWETESWGEIPADFGRK
jgi:ribonuclease HI